MRVRTHTSFQYVCITICVYKSMSMLVYAKYNYYMYTCDMFTDVRTLTWKFYCCQIGVAKYCFTSLFGTNGHLRNIVMQ